MSASESDREPKSDATSLASAPDKTEESQRSQSQLQDGQQSMQDNKELLSQARRFLATEEVQQGTREKKIEFLKSKGLTIETIEQLLAEDQDDASSQASSTAIATPSSSTTASESTSSSTPSFETPSQFSTPSTSMPPIVTYPEFLTTPQKPPPLITLPRLAKGLYAAASGGLALYGASRFVISPMVSNLTSARLSLAEAADAKVSALVSKLEGAVSVIPPYPSSSPHARKSKKRRLISGDDTPDSSDDESDALSDASDPTELFHRDIGVQTSSSLPSSPRPGSSLPSSSQPLSGTVSKPPSTAQADSLTRLTQSLRGLESSLDDQRDGTDQLGTLITLLNEDLDRLSAEGISAGATQSLSYMTGYRTGAAAGSREPEDEIKRARDGIRRLKGVLLSARSFPPAGATVGGK